MKKGMYLKREVLKSQPGGDGDDGSSEEGNNTGEGGKLL